jgi:hypothetical protein
VQRLHLQAQAWQAAVVELLLHRTVLTRVQGLGPNPLAVWDGEAHNGS